MIRVENNLLNTPSTGRISTMSVTVGVDEAGVGCAWGNLWASAVHIQTPIPGLCDSKKMTEKKRERMRTEVLATARYGMGEVTHVEIDEMGLGEARRLVFERALDNFAHKYDCIPDHIIVDGTLYRPWRDVAFTLEPRADSTYPCVSAASVLAKTSRDRQVIEWCNGPFGDVYAPYGIRNNKGYLSRNHIDAIRELGRTPVHRHSYQIRSLVTPHTHPVTSPPDVPE